MNDPHVVCLQDLSIEAQLQSLPLLRALSWFLPEGSVSVYEQEGVESLFSLGIVPTGIVPFIGAQGWRELVVMDLRLNQDGGGIPELSQATVRARLGSAVQVSPQEAVLELPLDPVQPLWRQYLRLAALPLPALANSWEALPTRWAKWPGARVRPTTLSVVAFADGFHAPTTAPLYQMGARLLKELPELARARVAFLDRNSQPIESSLAVLRDVDLLVSNELTTVLLGTALGTPTIGLLKLDPRIKLFQPTGGPYTLIVGYGRPVEQIAFTELKAHTIDMLSVFRSEPSPSMCGRIVLVT